MDAAAIARATAGADNVAINDGRMSVRGADVSGRNTDIYTAIKELQAGQAELERNARGRRKLTWGANEKRAVSQEGVVGEWNPNEQGYTFELTKRYHIQNRKILDAAGKRITLEEIANEKHTWTDRRGFHVAPSDREYMQLAFERHLLECLAADPNLCRHCVQFTAKNADDRMRHLFNEHPAEFKQIIDEGRETPIEPEVSADPLVCCGKKFKSLRAKETHQRFSKAHGGSGTVAA